MNFDASPRHPRLEPERKGQFSAIGGSASDMTSFSLAALVKFLLNFNSVGKFFEIKFPRTNF